MSVDRVDIDVDLEANEATATLEVAIEDLFDDDGELCLWESDDGWIGYRRESTDDGDAYFFVDTTIDDDWLSNLRVGERAIRLAVEQRIEDPDAGGAGTFIRSVPIETPEQVARPDGGTDPLAGVLEDTPDPSGGSPSFIGRDRP